METTLSARHAHLAAALRDPLTRAPAGLPRLPGDQARAKRLLREVRAAYALTHDHLSQIATAVPAASTTRTARSGGPPRAGHAPDSG